MYFSLTTSVMSYAQLIIKILEYYYVIMKTI